MTKAKSMKCIHCCLKGASVQCKTCDVAYHFVCGFKNDAAAFVFNDSMESFCRRHLPVQKVTKAVAKDRTCLAGCHEVVKKTERYKILIYDLREIKLVCRFSFLLSRQANVIQT